MFAIVGTIPNENFSLTCGPVALSGQKLIIKNQLIDIHRGTPALLATAVQMCDFFGAPPPMAYLIGDIGKGAGSRKLYAYLKETISDREYAGLTFHYIQPDVDWHNRVLFAIEDMAVRPVLIADAGFMYAAKMSGQAGAYDIFTPDIGELAFLADASAPHPFYTRGFIFHNADHVPEMIAQAYAHDNAAQYLFVKGKKDVLADKNGIIKAVSEPVIAALEAIGGTGDILTGMISALTGLGHDIQTACICASQISRLAGKMADPDPGTQVIDIIEKIPLSLKNYLKKKEIT